MTDPNKPLAEQGEHIRPLLQVERSVIVRALRVLYGDRSINLLAGHRDMARELADAIDDAGGVILTDSEGPY